MFRFAIASLLLAGLLTHPIAAAPQRIDAWYVDCDATLYCAAATILATGDTKLVFRIGRDSSNDAAWEMSFLAGDIPFDHDHTIALWVDGGPRVTFHPGEDYRAFGTARPEFFLTDGALAAPLLTAMADGSGFSMALSLDKTSATLTGNLAGLTKALTFIDQRQGRTATDRRVATPTHLPAHDLTKDTTPLADGGTGLRGLPARLIAHHQAQSACEALDGEALAKIDIIAGALDARSRLYALPCSKSGSEVTYRLYRLETGEIGGIETLYFAQYLDGFGWAGTDLLSGVGFDEKTATLTARGGRDAADACGSLATHRWKGWRFALVDYYLDTACKGGKPESWAHLYGGAP